MMASAERTRTISGSMAAGLCDDVVAAVAEQQQQQQQHFAHNDTTSTTFGALGNLNMFQNFASQIGETNSSSAMNLSQISTVSSADSVASAAAPGGGGASSSTAGALRGVSGGANAATTAASSSSSAGISISHTVGGICCRFPKLEECAHFHYERVQLGQILLRLVEDRTDLQSSNASQLAVDATSMPAGSADRNCWFIIRVTGEQSDPFLIHRSLDNLRMLDEMLHRCVYDRKISGLKDFNDVTSSSVDHAQLENLVAAYLTRFSNIMSDSLTCGPVLTWFQLDNKGRRLPVADQDTMNSINTPAVGAAYGIRKYAAQAVDEISIEVGDMISVIDMPSPADSTWWRGKKSHLEKSHYEVGFFPQSCVATIGDKVPRNLVLPAPLVGSLAVSPTKPVLRKHGKLIAFFRSFILSRPSRRRLKQSGIYKERVFSCDLSEHLLNSGQDIPMVLRCCAQFIEESGIVDGIYRLSGITSNIQKLRRSFDEERIPDFGQPDVRQDIHAMSSLLKMYFRELPNPLCTFQLYDNFVDAIQTRGDATERLRLMKETVQKLPPPHYRTLKYLARHLNNISKHHKSTGMTDRNLAIVWAPNLLRSPALETGDDYISGVAALRGVGVQAVVTEYLITNCSLIFDAAEEYDRYESLQYDSMTDTESLHLDQQREHHHAEHALFAERPKSLSVGGPKLISLEEAQTRRGGDVIGFIGSACGGAVAAASGLTRSMAIATPGHSHATSSSYIEVGGGPSSLPDKYHTVLPVPRSWSKRKTNSWKSLFTRNSHHPRTPNTTSTASSTSAKKVLTISHPSPLDISSTAGMSLTAVQLDGGNGGNGTAEKNLLRPADKLAGVSTVSKSIDMFDANTANGKPSLEMMRSVSNDSLRTVGHSRSVSHDSYFDLLQSPLRGAAAGAFLPGGNAAAATTASRELSELGLNFDREEPEMRIFSESESLVSSPRVCKDLSRRSTMRSRPETANGHGHGHNGNPSPKKQARLNIPGSSTTTAATNLTDLQWCSASTSSVARSGPADESMCKRYKLEDQLSDIQYIDCNTPEHCSTQPQTQAQLNAIYASAQVHREPSVADDISCPVVAASLQQSTMSESASTAAAGSLRYSYPGNRTPARHDERFSYPGMGRRYGDTTNEAGAACSERAAVPVRPPMKHLGRFSYCDPNAAAAMANEAQLTRCNSVDMSAAPNKNRLSSGSKLSIVGTPSTPGHSPRYSLLAETGSEYSSGGGGAATPPSEKAGGDSHCGLLMAPTCDSRASATPSPSSARCENARTANASLMTTSCPAPAVRDIAQIKREMSLDLHSTSTKLGPIDAMSASHCAPMSVHMHSTPNTPNNTTTTETSGGGNTSASVTPSEFGYHHLNASRHSVAVSPALESPKSPSDAYETMERSFGGPPGSSGPMKSRTHLAASPIRSTINITYNLRSPCGGKSSTHENVFFCSTASPASTMGRTTTADTSADYELVSVVKIAQQQLPGDEADAAGDESKKPLLETSFDENMVYEQVKFFKGAVSEINSMLSNATELKDNGNSTLDSIMDADSGSDCEAVPDSQDTRTQLDNIGLSSTEATPTTTGGITMATDDKSMLTAAHPSTNGGPSHSDESTDADVPMHDQDLDDIQDSLELDLNGAGSMYENVDMRRPDSVYENVDLAAQQQHRQTAPAGTFNVRQLAHKFESTSPCEDSAPPMSTVQNASVDYARPFGRRLDSNRNSSFGSTVASDSRPVHSGDKKSAHVLHGSSNITRSLDENAFIREFGAHKLLPVDVTKSVQQINRPHTALTLIAAVNAQETESNRRIAMETSRPKSLNPPKRLPDLLTNSGQRLASSNEADLLKSVKVPAHTVERITPTTENPISLIQHNVIDRDSLDSSTTLGSKMPSDDERSLNNVQPSSKSVGIGKLDRERIEKIKEERRLQLNEKFRTNSGDSDSSAAPSNAPSSVKSRSKSRIELRELRDDPITAGVELRFKSNSRGDVRAMRCDSRESLNALAMLKPIGQPGRIRRISDERNQNDCAPQEPANGSSVSTKARKFDAPKSASGAGVLAIGSSGGSVTMAGSRLSLGSSQRERISPQFNIRDVAAMFESRSQQ